MSKYILILTLFLARRIFKTAFYRRAWNFLLSFIAPCANDRNFIKMIPQTIVIIFRPIHPLFLLYTHRNRNVESICNAFKKAFIFCNARSFRQSELSKFVFVPISNAQFMAVTYYAPVTREIVYSMAVNRVVRFLKSISGLSYLLRRSGPPTVSILNYKWSFEFTLQCRNVQNFYKRVLKR